LEWVIYRRVGGKERPSLGENEFKKNLTAQTFKLPNGFCCDSGCLRLFSFEENNLKEKSMWPLVWMEYHGIIFQLR